MELLEEEVEMSYEYIGKSNMTAGNHYLVTLERNGSSMTFDYHTNIYDELHVSEIVECLLMDRMSMECLYPNYWTVDNFRREFGYHEDDKSDEEIERIMETIEKNSKDLETLFTEDELETIKNDLNI